MSDILVNLAKTIKSRKGSDPESSWTARLLSQGVDKAAEKFGEEAVETVIAAVKADSENLAHEAADVLYHLLVLLEASDVALDDVLKELEQRQGQSGIEEKRAR